MIVASEVIALLEKNIEKHGDLPCLVPAFDQYGNACCEVFIDNSTIELEIIHDDGCLEGDLKEMKDGDKYFLIG